MIAVFWLLRLILNVSFSERFLIFSILSKSSFFISRTLGGKVINRFGSFTNFPFCIFDFVFLVAPSTTGIFWWATLVVVLTITGMLYFSEI